MRPRLICGLLVLGLLAGCGLIPRDPRDTLDGVRDTGELVVGISAAPPWTIVDGDRVSGSEVDLVHGFAERLGVEVRFEPGGEQHLVEDLEEGEIHLLIGGITADSPWTSKASPTRSYRTTQEGGKQRKHVMLVRLGENRFLTELETYLDEQTGKIR